MVKVINGEDLRMIYPLVNVYSLLLKMAIEIVDLPIHSVVIFHSYVSLPEVIYNIWATFITTFNNHQWQVLMGFRGI